MKKKPEATARTKQKIVDAFWSLYCDKRIEKITVKEITDRAGYYRSTFYEYFADVYDVLDYIEDGIIPSLEELPRISVHGVSFGMPIEMFLNIYEKNSTYYSVLLGDKGDPAFAGKLKKSIKEITLKAFTEKLNISSMEIDYILEYALSGLIGLMTYRFEQKAAITNKEWVALLNRLTNQGVVRQLR